MISGKIRKSGNSFIVTIPRKEMERLSLTAGQLVTIEVRPAEVRQHVGQAWIRMVG